MPFRLSYNTNQSQGFHGGEITYQVDQNGDLEASHSSHGKEEVGRLEVGRRARRLRPQSLSFAALVQWRR